MLPFPSRVMPARSRVHSLLRYHRQRIDWDAESCPHTRAIARLKRTRVYRGHCEGMESSARQRLSDRLLSAYA